MRHFKSPLIILFLTTITVISIAVWKTGGAAQLSDSRQALGKSRLEVARQLYDLRVEQFRTGEVVSDDVYTWSRHVLHAEADLARTAKERASAAAGHLSRMKTLQDFFAEEMRKNPHGCYDRYQILAVDYYVKEAEFSADGSGLNGARP
jgi:chromosome condensin MukBEF complex kleisin-like MukF subunit